MELAQWLARIECLHPQAIEMGLERLRPVAGRLLGDQRLARRVVVVAGTNGKGSTCATLEALGLAHGLRVGCYTSPHLQRFNERVRLNGIEADDAALAAAFERVEQAREGVPLTYFEFTTLAAFHLFAHHALDLAILEVGMGGRLDAVNSIDADVCVITTVDLDHQAWLGPDRESIGAEKAGILRPNTPLVIGEGDPPRTVLQRAEALQCPVFRWGETFGGERDVSDEGESAHTMAWTWWGASAEGGSCRWIGLFRQSFPLANQATALQAFALCGFQMQEPAVREALRSVSLRGRLQVVGRDPIVMLDVAHNPHAAGCLADALRAQGPQSWIGVFSALGDKDIAGIRAALADRISAWHVWVLPEARAASADQLRRALQPDAVTVHDGFAGAWQAALREAGKRGAIVIFGSFHVVAAALNESPWARGPLSGPALHNGSSEQR